MKKVVIIGAGVSGLCAGSYLQMNGYDTEIFELHNVPGGLCTGWERKGYTFDGCIHFVAGSSPSDPIYRIWNELIDMSSIEFVDPEQQFRFVSSRGEEFNLYCDPERLEQELMRIAPDDAPFIRTFIKAIRKFWDFEIPFDKAPEVMGVVDKIKMMIKMLPYMRLLLKYGKVSVAEVGMKWKTPLLRDVFTHNKLFNEFAFFGLIMSLAWYGKKNAGYPIGGSLPFAKKFETRYKELGGKIQYDSKVTEILVENDRAKGIRLENGEKADADIVISAADGHYTIYEMLKGEYIDKKIDELYSGNHRYLSPYPSLVYVSFGVARRFDDFPHQVIYQLEKPILVDDETEHSALNTTIYNFDPTLAPKGKTLVNVMFESFGHQYWTGLRKNDKKKYNKEKQRIAEEVIDLLEEKIGNFKKHVEVVDVATPATFIRYTNNWNGSYEGWLLAPGALNLSMSKELPGLKNFYQIGQWVEPGGGLPTAIRSGRNITQIICKKDKKKFVSRTSG